METPHDVTELLLQWSKGSDKALDELMPLVFAELQKIAHRYLQNERESHTLQTTALVNEAYLKLIDQNRIEWQNRAHFFGVAANIMRRILVDYARKHLADKRGGDAVKIPIDAGMIDISDERAGDLIELDAALKKLAEVQPDSSRVIELRYFGGLSIENTAEVLGISESSVVRQWRLARAWLYREIAGA